MSTWSKTQYLTVIISQYNTKVRLHIDKPISGMRSFTILRYVRRYVRRIIRTASDNKWNTMNVYLLYSSLISGSLYNSKALLTRTKNNGAYSVHRPDTIVPIVDMVDLINYDLYFIVTINVSIQYSSPPQCVRILKT